MRKKRGCGGGFTIRVDRVFLSQFKKCEPSGSIAGSAVTSGVPVMRVGLRCR